MVIVFITWQLNCDTLRKPDLLADSLSLIIIADIFTTEISHFVIMHVHCKIS